MKQFPLLRICLCALLLSASAQTVLSQSSVQRLIPAPVKMTEHTGQPFRVTARTEVLYPKSHPEWKRIARFLTDYLNERNGYDLSVRPFRPSASFSAGKGKGCILFETDRQLPPEGFTLHAEENGIRIKAADEAGAFYAVQTLKELSLPENGKEIEFAPFELEDYPAMHYRGSMLDVSRHFFTVGQVKRYIDLLAFHRINHFHWHLTDDQGWRIEIKQYPELTRKGAWRGADNYGGFYTQEEIKEIVKYAAERYITVIPEIDMPGHSLAALAAYPQLGCRGTGYEVATEVGGVHKDVLCMGSDLTMTFVKNVLREVAELFSASYIHIGGDEVPKDRWKECKACQAAIREKGLKATDKHTAEELLQTVFNEELAHYLKGLGKHMTGWDEVLTEGIDRDIIIMSWRGLGRASAAARQGHTVIASADPNFYLNHYQTLESEKEPRATGGLSEMKKLYETSLSFPELTEKEKERILGIESCLWSSFITSDSLMDYMLLPRLAAFSEVAWCGARRGSYFDFLERLPQMLQCYQNMDYGHSTHYFTVESSYRSKPGEKCLEISLESMPGTEIRYTLDGNTPTRKASLYQAPLQIKESCSLRAIAYMPRGVQSDVLEKDIVINKATFKPVSLLTTPARTYEGENGKVLVDGMRSISFHTTGQWVGCSRTDLSAVIDLESEQTVSTVEVSALSSLSAWIMAPKSISVSLSSDGESYAEVAKGNYPASTDPMEQKRSDVYKLTFASGKARYVKVTVTPCDALPRGHSGEGIPPFLFVDEIRID